MQASQQGRNVTQMLALLASLVMAIYLVVENYAKRPALRWVGAPAVMVASGKPGGETSITYSLEKRREECITIPHLMRFEVIDSSGESFIVNQRSGIPNNMPNGAFSRNITFEIPRFAHPGLAYVVLHATFTCEWPPGFNWLVYQALPPIPFEIEAADNG